MQVSHSALPIRQGRVITRQRESRHIPRDIQGAPPQYKSAPTLRLERMVVTHGVYNEEWHDYIDAFALQNRHLKVKAFGGLACTYVESSDLNKMLATEYPDDYQDQKRLAILQKSFVTNFRVFVRNCLEGQKAVERELYAERFGETALQSLGVPTQSPYPDMWHRAEAIVRPNLAIADGNSLVLDLKDNDFIYAEMATVYDYLENDEHLDLSLIRRKDDKGRPLQKPHITVVRSNRNLRDLGIAPPLETPYEITLDKPRAWRERDTIRVLPVAEMPDL